MDGSVRRVVGTLSAACVASGLIAALAPLAANAAVVDYSLCDGARLSQPFLQWGDAAEYKLAPGGDFESGLSGWSLSGGAGLASGSESYGVAGSLGASSLSLPAGGVATSPQSCVNAAYPNFASSSAQTTPAPW